MHIEKEHRDSKEIYEKCGYGKDIVDENLKDRFHTKTGFTPGGNIVFTHYVNDKALFTEEFDDLRKIWVYKTLKGVK